MAVAVVAIVVLGVMLIVMAIVRAGRRDTRSVDRYQETLRRLHHVEDAGSSNPSGDGDRTSVIHVRVLPPESAEEAAERPEVVSPVRVRRRPGAGASVRAPSVANPAQPLSAEQADSPAAQPPAGPPAAPDLDGTAPDHAGAAPALDGAAPDPAGVAPAASRRPAEDSVFDRCARAGRGPARSSGVPAGAGRAGVSPGHSGGLRC